MEKYDLVLYADKTSDMETASHGEWVKYSDVESLQTQLKELQTLVSKQVKDEGLWFIAETAPEAYLQQELRKLHFCIEGGLNNKPLTPSGG